MCHSCVTRGVIGCIHQNKDGISHTDIKEKKMKKNFLKVAALLIAAMLMVVSCSQEVTPKTEDNGLVEVSVGVAYGKDVTVGYTHNEKITYQYKLTALWDKLTNGSKPYGETSDFVNMFGSETKTLESTGLTATLDYVTPGYWLVEVRGLVGDKVVLQGSTKAYFNINDASTTVYVAPVKNENTEGKVTITLLMEDLDADDANDSKVSKVKYAIDNGTTTVVDKIAKASTSDENKSFVNDKAVHEYSVTLNNVKAGYHTITFTVDGYVGGITKSFLMIPGNDVTIKGSVYPSKFSNSGANISVVSLGSANITVGEGDNSRVFNSAGLEPVVVTGGTSVKVAIGTISAPINGKTVVYQWYLNGEKKGNEASTTTTSIEIPNEPGEYNITCIAKFSYSDSEIGKVTVYGNSAYAGKVIVTEVATTSTTVQGQ